MPGNLSVFAKRFYETIIKLPIHCIGSVVSKKGMKMKYSKVVFDPSPIAYELLLQHIANYLTQYSIEKIEIYFDDMSGKNPKGSEWKKLLIKQHENLKKGRSPLYKTWIKRKGMDYFKIPETIEFNDSSKNVYSQLVDMCAYNVMRQARDYSTFDGDKMYEGYKWIKPIMHCDPTSRKITRFGAVYFP